MSRDAAYKEWLAERSRAQAVSTIPIQTAYFAGYDDGLAASPSEEVEAALVAADRLAEYVEFQGRSGHNWPTTAEAQRTYITVRRALAALRTTKEEEDSLAALKRESGPAV